MIASRLRPTFGALLSAVVLLATLVAADIDGAQPSQAAGTPSSYVSTPPARIGDTGSGVGFPVGKFTAGQIKSLKVTGVGGIPTTGVVAVAVTVTSVGPTAYGGLTLYNAGQPRPVVTNLLVTVGENNSNLAIVEPDANGFINVYHSSGGHVIVETRGYFQAGTTAATYDPIPPQRLLDTRSGLGRPGATPIPAGTRVDVSLSAIANLPSDVTAVFVTLAAINPTAAGRIYAWDAASPSPIGIGSYNAGENNTMSAIVPISALRKIAVQADSQIHVTLDMFGLFRASSAGTAFTPTAVRMYDTRTATPLQPNQVVVVETRVKAPFDTAVHSTIAMNLHSLNATAAGVLRLWPEGTREPVSSLTFTANENASNLVFIAENTQGRILLRNASTGPVHVVIDAQGYFFDPAADDVGLLTPDPDQQPVEVVAGPEDEAQLTAPPTAAEDPETDPGNYQSNDTTQPIEITGNGSGLPDPGPPAYGLINPETDLSGESAAEWQAAKTDGSLLVEPDAVPVQPPDTLEDGSTPAPPVAEATYSDCASATAHRSSLGAEGQEFNCISNGFAENDSAGFTDVREGASANGLAATYTGQFPVKCLYGGYGTTHYGRYEWCGRAFSTYRSYNLISGVPTGGARLEVYQHLRMIPSTQAWEMRAFVVKKKSWGRGNFLQLAGDVFCASNCKVVQDYYPDVKFRTARINQVFEGRWRLSLVTTTTKLADQRFRLRAYAPGVPYIVGENFRNSPRVRCENKPYFNTNIGRCSFPEAKPIFVMKRSDPVVGASATFVYDAQRRIPIPYGASYANLQGPPLRRLKDPFLQFANRFTACPPSPFFQRYDASDSCDEYPFASTRQGAAFLGLNQTARGHVPLSANTNAGARLSGFYANYRVLDGDPFFVVIQR